MEKTMGEEDAFRTVECLRGRLLAERVASKNAKEEAQLMGNKLIELENRLKEETKSRNRAEKRLKFLMKKLESISISLVSDESENSSLTEGSDVSSASYTANSSSKDLEDKMPKTRPACSSEGDSPETMENAKPDNEKLEADSKKCDVEEPSNMTKNVAILNNVEKIGSGFSTYNQVCNSDSFEENLSSSGEDHHGKSIELEFSEKKDLSARDGNSSRTPSDEKETTDLDGEENVDNSLALVPVDLPKPKQTIDPAVLDATVRDVLDSLRHAKEKLQNQMERRRMIKVG